MQSIRSLLFVPGNREDMLEKALALSPDVLVPDLEDSVPKDPAEKARARQIVSSMLSRLAEASPLVIPRVNSVDSGLMEDDLAAVVGPHIDGVSVGKIGIAEDVEAVSRTLARLERETALPDGKLALIPWLETASGVQNAFAICGASPRVAAVAFGAEDFSRDMGIDPADSPEMAYPRSAVAVAAVAARVQPLDTPYVRFRDVEGLEADCRVALRFGFTGKFAIHPAQIEAINAAFAPSADEIERAGKVIEAYEEASRSGSGATSLDGSMIDEPVVARARNLIEAARRTPDLG